MWIDGAWPILDDCLNDYVVLVAINRKTESESGTGITYGGNIFCLDNKELEPEETASGRVSEEHTLGKTTVSQANDFATWTGVRELGREDRLRAEKRRKGRMKPTGEYRGLCTSVRGWRHFAEKPSKHDLSTIIFQQLCLYASSRP